MKVLFVTNMYPVPDYIYFGIHVKEQITALEKFKGITDDVYFINGREKKSNYFKSISEIKQKIKQGNYDLVHIHYGISGLFLLFFKPDIPCIITLHSGELFRKKGLINHLLQKNLTLAVVKRVQKVIVLNDDMINLLAPYKEKLIKLPCGTDISLFKENGAVNASDKILIGFPGNKARPEKNYALFAGIIDKLSETHQVEVIEFHNLTRDQVINNLNRIDLLLMTSLVEGSPQIIKEAMACNKPIVSSSVGDVMDLLDKVENSYIINSFNAPDFTAAVEKVLSIPKSERKSNGLQKLLDMGLDSVSVSENLYKIYTSL